jgi:CheY-like chemotaxis protein
MRPANILVVEDDTAVRRLAKWILEDEGYRVYEAANGSEALEVAHQLQCGLNLLLTDMLMPGIDGHDLIRAIRRICPHMDTILMTGALTAGDVRSRNYPVLLKPFSRAQLLTTVKQIINAQL